MILDASVVVALLRREAGHEGDAEQLDAADIITIGAPTLVEADIVLTSRMGAAGRAALTRFVTENEIEVLEFGEAHWREAGRAFMQFGKGRHPAALNYGDCMTYAAARLAREPLLCLGADFPQRRWLATPSLASSFRARASSSWALC